MIKDIKNFRKCLRIYTHCSFYFMAGNFLKTELK